MSYHEAMEEQLGFVEVLRIQAIQALRNLKTGIRNDIIDLVADIVRRDEAIHCFFDAFTALDMNRLTRDQLVTLLQGAHRALSRQETAFDELLSAIARHDAN